MLKDILSLKELQVLSKNEQKKVSGGGPFTQTNCPYNTCAYDSDCPSGWSCPTGIVTCPKCQPNGGFK